MIHDTKRVARTGGGAAAEAMRQANPDVVPAYPITPQTPIIETFAKMQAEGKVDTEMILVESEHSAMSACVGASAAGARTITASSSQGIELMHEILYIASGLQLPIVMFVSARALAAPINIHGDHSDVMGARDTGWIQIFCESVQEVYDLGIIGIKLAEKVSMPTMVIMDGFVTSHSTEDLYLLEDQKVKDFYGEYKADKHLFDFNYPHSFGVVGLPDSYFEFKIEQEERLEKTIGEYKKIVEDFEKISARNYDYFEEYKTSDAEYILVAAGSTAGTAKGVVDKLRAKGEKVGLLKIRLFRPFPREEIEKALEKAKKIAVLDKSIAFGSLPPLASEIMLTVGKEKVSSYVYGLGGRSIFAKDIESVFKSLTSKKENNPYEFEYLGTNWYKNKI